MDLISRARRVFEIEIAEMRAVAERLDDRFGSAVELLQACLSRRGKVIVLGVGKSGHIGEKIAATLTSTGCPAVTLNSLNALHGDLGIIADGDVILALSYSGQTDELVDILPVLARFGTDLIAITGNAESALGRAATLVLDVQVSQEACPLGLAPTSSTTAMLALGDALAMVLLEARGFRKEDFAKYHPGGQLGRALLLRVEEIMRPSDRMAVVWPDTPILDVVKAMTQKRAGAAVVVDSSGGLAGVFTQGDFARHYPEVPDIGARAVGDFMTTNPITIAADKLAAEVLHILETHRIDDLIVIGSNGQPVGIVDSQDLSRHRLI